MVWPRRGQYPEPSVEWFLCKSLQSFYELHSQTVGQTSLEMQRFLHSSWLALERQGVKTKSRTAPIWAAYPGDLQLTVVDCAAPSSTAFFDSIICPIYNVPHRFRYLGGPARHTARSKPLCSEYQQQLSCPRGGPGENCP
jgi:hypothetical protein